MAIDLPRSIAIDLPRSILINLRQSISINLRQSISIDRDRSPPIDRNRPRSILLDRSRSPPPIDRSSSPPSPAFHVREEISMGGGGSLPPLPPPPPPTWEEIPQWGGGEVYRLPPPREEIFGKGGFSLLFSPSPILPASHPGDIFGGRGAFFSLSRSHVTRGRGEREEGWERERGGPTPRQEKDGGPHVKKKNKNFFLLEIMIHLEVVISPSFLICFRCFWAGWKALDE